ncbi:MarR family winged helix-turn-helix transcriptional regulator [Aquimarina rhabdastrellae]
MLDKEVLNKEMQSTHAMSYFKLIQTSSWIDMKIKKALKPYNLTHTQLNVLSILVKEHPKPMTSKAIKEQLIVLSPDITRLLDRLVKKGLTKRETNTINRREIDITVTEEGIAFYYQVHKEVVKEVNNYFEKSITEEEAKQLFKILNKIMK